MAVDKLLKEDGSALLKEDGGGILLALGVSLADTLLVPESVTPSLTAPVVALDKSLSDTASLSLAQTLTSRSTISKNDVLQVSENLIPQPVVDLDKTLSDGVAVGSTSWVTAIATAILTEDGRGITTEDGKRLIKELSPLNAQLHDDLEVNATNVSGSAIGMAVPGNIHFPVYVVDELGNRVTDQNGNFLITKYDPTDEVSVSDRAFVISFNIVSAAIYDGVMFYDHIEYVGEVKPLSKIDTVAVDESVALEVNIPHVGLHEDVLIGESKSLVPTVVNLELSDTLHVKSIPIMLPNVMAMLNDTVEVDDHARYWHEADLEDSAVVSEDVKVGSTSNLSLYDQFAVKDKKVSNDIELADTVRVSENEGVWPDKNFARLVDEVEVSESLLMGSNLIFGKVYDTACMGEVERLGSLGMVARPTIESLTPVRTIDDNTTVYTVKRK